MPFLTLKFQEKPLGEFDLAPGKTLAIGRRPENEVAIDNLAVSGLHAKIDSIGNEFIFTDLQSKNGSFINGQMVSTHKLQHGDVITIGKHTLEFAYKEGEERPQKNDDDLYQTMVMDTNQHREMMKKTKPKAAATPAPKAAPKSLPRAALSLVAGGEGEVLITKKLFKVGKGTQNDFQVEGLWVGQTAFTISLRPDGYYLSYGEGIAKPKINGSAVKSTVRLKEFDMIELGKVKMQLVYKTPKKK
jgi:pSer/pThr/pTyr-binding forkhead associated (FHA) protein